MLMHFSCELQAAIYTSFPWVNLCEQEMAGNQTEINSHTGCLWKKPVQVGILCLYNVITFIQKNNNKQTKKPTHTQKNHKQPD